MEKKNLIKILLIVNLVFGILSTSGVAYLIIKDYNQQNEMKNNFNRNGLTNPPQFDGNGQPGGNQNDSSNSDSDTSN